MLKVLKCRCGEEVRVDEECNSVKCGVCLVGFFLDNEEKRLSIDGSRIKAKRSVLSLTQDALSYTLKLPLSTLGKMERNEVPISEEVLTWLEE